MTAQITIRHLTKSFKENPVLQGVDLDIPSGSSHVIIGSSGSGKSVFLKCILGLIAPDAGQIFIGGHNVSQGAVQEPEVLKRISMMFQGSALFDSLSVWENVAFLLLQQGMSAPAARTRALSRLSQVGLPSRVADLSPSEISGGMQRRVALARAIISDPEILFFDEPTTGLDPIMTSVIYDLILSCVRDIGATALTITHDMAGARLIADQISLLHQGKIVWQGMPQDMSTSSDPYMRQFVQGSPHGPMTTVLS